MEATKIKQDIIDFIKIKLEEEGIEDIEVTEESGLIGDGGIIDSMGIVELCLFLEDKVKPKFWNLIGHLIQLANSKVCLNQLKATDTFVEQFNK